MFYDENDQARGCAIIEFECAESVRRAVEKMHRYINGRKLVVKELDYDVNEDKLKEVFDLAGTDISAELRRDTEGHS